MILSDSSDSLALSHDSTLEDTISFSDDQNKIPDHLHICEKIVLVTNILDIEIQQSEPIVLYTNAHLEPGFNDYLDDIINKWNAHLDEYNAQYDACETEDERMMLQSPQLLIYRKDVAYEAKIELYGDGSEIQEFNYHISYVDIDYLLETIILSGSLYDCFVDSLLM